MEITLENVLEIIAGITLIAAWIELGKCRSEIYMLESRIEKLEGERTFNEIESQLHTLKKD